MLGIEYVVSVSNKYFAPVFTNEKNVDDRKISGGGDSNMQGQFEITKKGGVGIVEDHYGG